MCTVYYIQRVKKRIKYQEELLVHYQQLGWRFVQHHVKFLAARVKGQQRKMSVNGKLTINKLDVNNDGTKSGSATYNFS